MALASSGLLAQRLLRLREAMAAAGCESLLVTRGPNVFYLSNFAGSAGSLLVTPTQLFLLVDSRYVTAAEGLLESDRGPAECRLERVRESYDETVASLWASAGTRVAGFEAEHLTVSRHAWLAAHLPPDATLLPTYGLVERLRERKDGHELVLLRTAGRVLAEVARAIRGEVRPGRSEREVAGAIEQAMRTAGFSRPAFDTIVASGPNGALPHATAGERVIRPGDLVVLDFGGVWEGYCVDLTRTVSVGPPGPTARRVFAAVLGAQRAAIEAVRPGVLSGELDRAARAVLEREGLGEAFGHATGHGLGLEVHEDPRIARRRSALGEGRAREAGSVPLEPGMVFTIEPGAYLPGWGGVRIEDDVLVTDEGVEVLTQPWGEPLDAQILRG